MRTQLAAISAALLAVLLHGAASAQTADDVLRRIRERYDEVRDLQITFTLQTSFAGSRVERRSDGTLLLKKEGKYRVDTGDRVLVTDGSTVWSFTPATRQVLVDRVRPESPAWSPERILTGDGGDVTATALGTNRVQGRELTGIKLLPQEDGAAFRSLKLWADPDDWLIRRAEAEDLNGVTTMYTVTAIRVNPGLADARFTFVVPDSADVVDLR